LGGGDDCDQLWFYGVEEALVEALERGIVADGDQGTPMKRAARTCDLPPPMKLLPFHWPDWRVQGTRAAILRRSSRPSSGNSVIRVRAMVGPTPGTEASRSSFSRQAGEPHTASSMSVSRLESSFCSAASRRRCFSAGAFRSGAFGAGDRRRSSGRFERVERQDRAEAGSFRQASA
jgi:hypothetical protein